MEIQRALVIAASRRVKAGAGITDLLGETFFDIHMNIFELDGERECPFIDLFFDREKTLGDLFLILFGNDPMSRQHFGMGDRAGDVFTIHAAVIGNGCIEIQCILFLCLREASAPHHITHFAFFSFMRARMVSGRPKRLMKPSASA